MLYRRIWHSPYALMSILVVFWGSFTAISKWTLNDLSSWQMQFYLFAWAMLGLTVMLPFGGRYKLIARLGAARTLRLCAYGTLSYLNYALYTASLKRIPAVEAAMLNYLFPIAIIVFAVWLYREKLTVGKWLLTLAALLGTYVIITNGQWADLSLTNVWGDLLALGSALCWGLFSILTRQDDSPLFASVFIYILVSFLLATGSLLLFSEWVLPSWPTLASIGYLGLTSNVVSYFLWFQALRITSVVMASSISYVTPFVTLLFIVILLGESISWYQLGGFVWILVCVFAQGRLDRRLEGRARHAGQI